jgi:hypothetical protein
MLTIRLAEAVLFLFGPFGISVAQPQNGTTTGSDKTYVDAECGFKFSYASIWSVTREPASPQARHHCEYRIGFTRGGSNGQVIRHRVGVVLTDHEFAGIDREERFHFNNGAWYEDRGSAGEVEAHQIRGINWIGMEMPDGFARCYGDQGYEGAGWSPTATLFGFTLKRMARLDGGLCEQADLDGIRMMVRTFEFIPIDK